MCTHDICRPTFSVEHTRRNTRMLPHALRGKDSTGKQESRRAKWSHTRVSTAGMLNDGVLGAPLKKGQERQPTTSADTHRNSELQLSQGAIILLDWLQRWRSLRKGRTCQRRQSKLGMVRKKRKKCAIAHLASVWTITSFCLTQQAGTLAVILMWVKEVRSQWDQAMSGGLQDGKCTPFPAIDPPIARNFG